MSEPTGAVGDDSVDKTRLSQSPFDQLLQLRIVMCSDGEVVGEVPVVPHMRQPTGVLHGGVFAAVAEALASGGVNWAVYYRGEVGLGMRNDTEFVRPLSGDVLRARAVVRHRGSTRWIWDVDMTDEDDRLCAISRVAIAVRPAPETCEVTTPGPP